LGGKSRKEQMSERRGGIELRGVKPSAANQLGNRLVGEEGKRKGEFEEPRGRDAGEGFWAGRLCGTWKEWLGDLILRCPQVEEKK